MENEKIESFGEYQTLAQRTSSNSDAHNKILNGIMGLAGESGECVDIYKKHMFQGHPLDIKHLEEELGDVLWYCAELASGLEMLLSEAATNNIAKLRKRYPDGFDPARSINRKEES